MQPAVYLSRARLQFDAKEDSSILPNAAQSLTSGELLEKVAQQVDSLDAGRLREMLSASPVPGSSVIELSAEGNQRELLPRVLAAWIDVYRSRHVENQDQSSAAALSEARRSVDQLQQHLAGKRREIEAFRRKFDIVSMEREENQSMARLKGLNAALNEARNREINAEARVNATRENLAAGRVVRTPGDKTIIADLEKRALDLRERMKDLEQDYTPQYLALDTKYKALRANLAQLEQRIAREQGTSAQQVLQAVEEELTSARQTVLRLQSELAARKGEAQDFTSRFAEHTALTAEVRRLEESYAAARESVAQLSAEKKPARPKVTVLSPPNAPDRPVRPDYARDALFSIGGSGVLGLLAVWFVEFFRRSGVPQPAPAPAQPIIQIAITPGALTEALRPALAAASPPRLTAAIAGLPRELSAQEMDALLDAAAPRDRAAIAALLDGRSPPADEKGAAPSRDDVAVLIARAANDAGLTNPSEVTAEVLHHTFVARQIRQRG